MARSSTPRSSTPRSASARKPRAIKSGPTAVLISLPERDHVAIASRAYELFLDGGSRHGYDLEHWLQAEQELRAGALTSAA